MSSNWKIVRDGNTWLKVIDFPVPEDSPVAGESMWVKLVEGDDCSGTGVLDNGPAFCTVCKHGDLVEYANGTDSIKPSFSRIVVQEQ